LNQEFEYRWEKFLLLKELKIDICHCKSKEARQKIQKQINNIHIELDDKNFVYNSEEN